MTIAQQKTEIINLLFSINIPKIKDKPKEKEK